MTFSPYGLGTCHDCGAPVRWATTEAGKSQALNPEPDPAGNVAGRLGEGPGWWARVPTADRPWHPGERRFMPHAATCSTRKITRPQLPAGVISLANRRKDTRHG